MKPKHLPPAYRPPARPMSQLIPADPQRYHQVQESFLHASPIEQEIEINFDGANPGLDFSPQDYLQLLFDFLDHQDADLFLYYFLPAEHIDSTLLNLHQLKIRLLQRIHNPELVTIQPQSNPPLPNQVMGDADDNTEQLSLDEQMYRLYIEEYDCF